MAYGSVAFQDYLEAKFEIDESSINRDVWEMFASRLDQIDRPCVLDVGAGTGATLRRLIRLGARLGKGLEYVGLDTDSENIPVAIETCSREIGSADAIDRGTRTLETGGETGISAEFVTGDLLDLPSRIRSNPFSVVVAHALLDVLPLERSLRSIVDVLEPGGVVYSAINYDGTTSIFPAFEDGSFEHDLLEAYDRSMDQRRVSGEHAGGSRTGSKLFAVFEEAGLGVIGFGASDWSLFAKRGFELPQRTFLEALIAMIANEGLRHPQIDHSLLDAWFHDRMDRIARGTLAFIVHQTDILGQRL